ncbi:MAG TPA: hypothetical protein DDZ83_13625 [Nitrospinae bacterium]|jgi:hypothetical protein|nr:hypothetical protein [Nitrospinota bacterium]
MKKSWRLGAYRVFLEGQWRRKGGLDRHGGGWEVKVGAQWNDPPKCILLTLWFGDPRIERLDDKR